VKVATGVRSDLGGRAADLDLGLHVYRHGFRAP
jgi:hypothetical protein